MRVHSQLAAIRKAGHPVTLAELDKWYPEVPVNENAATLYEKAFSSLEIDSEAKELLDYEQTNALVRSVSISPERRAKIGDLLAKNQQALNFLHQGAALGKSRYAIDLKKGSDLALSHLRQLKDGVRLLLLKAVLSAEEDKPDEMFHALDDAIHLARSVAVEPVLLSQLVLLTSLNMTISVFEQMVSRGRLSDAQLATISKELHAVENPEMWRGLAGERCSGIKIFYLPAVKLFGTNADSSIRTRMTFQKLSGIWDMELSVFLTIMGESVAAARKPFPQQIVKAKELDDRIGEKHDSDPGFLQLPGGHSIALMLLPTVETAHVKSTETSARLVTAQVGAAVERYRISNGTALPESLGQLVPNFLPSVPIDPFDGKPYRYKKLAKGFIVYSVGADGKDDGGLEKDAKKHSAPYDVTFIIER